MGWSAGNVDRLSKISVKDEFIGVEVRETSFPYPLSPTVEWTVGAGLRVVCIVHMIARFNTAMCKS